MNLVNGTYLLHVSESVSAAVRPQRPPGASQSSASCRHFSASPCPAWPVVVRIKENHIIIVADNYQGQPHVESQSWQQQSIAITRCTGRELNDAEWEKGGYCDGHD
ncbi:uncharacterized protein ppp1r3c2a isoform X5 [Sparus aurata]|uniref:uncharacterized protein ppp1r3c2a isoform X5 n=1 Tax=Sparus aurata TaxID=8175 RepID=UPI0011C15F32|nr:uncharacterized protein LOC115592345 isoform X5 [Sparus aurata]